MGVCIIGFGLIVLFQLNRAVLRQQILPIGIFRTLGLLAVLAFSISSLWEWLRCRFVAAFRAQRFKLQQPRYLDYRSLHAHHRFLVHPAPVTIGGIAIGLSPLTTPPRHSNQVAKGPRYQGKLFPDGLDISQR